MIGGRTGYRILDEPTPGGLASYVVNPTFPLFGLMLGGAWLGLPWFAFNAVALGSPTARREIGLATAALAGAALIALGLLIADSRGLIPSGAAPYLLLISTTWKLGLGYWLFMLQSRTFHLYVHFDGRVRNGIFVLIVGAFFVRGQVLALFKHPLWILTAS